MKESVIEKLYSVSERMSKKQRKLYIIAVIISTAFLYVMFLLAIRYCFDFSFDEPFYLSICERLFRGDRLIIDEAALPQFTALFQYLPFLLFRKITGSTEGVVLFMRAVYLCTNFSFYCYILIRLRKRPWLALSTAFLFSSFVPLCAFLFGYYYLPLIFLFSFSLIVVDEDAGCRQLRLVLAGILLSCAVILNPGMALVWMVYCVFVLIRLIFRKKGKTSLSEFDFILNINVFKFLLTGVIISAAVFILYIAVTCGLGDAIGSISNMRMDASGERAREIAGFALFRLHFSETVEKYGVFFWLMLLATIASVVYRMILQKLSNNETIKKVVFALSIVVMFASQIYLTARGFDFRHVVLMEAPIMIAWLGMNCFFISEKSNSKMLFLWLVGFTYSITQDTISMVTRGFGCALCIFPSLNLLVQVYKEFKEKSIRSKTHKKGRALEIVTTLAMVSIVIWSLTNVVSFTILFRGNLTGEQRYELTEGPYKGLKMPEKYTELYNNLIYDLDKIKNEYDEPVFIMAVYPVGYLYLENDINVVSTGNSFMTVNEEYWEKYPQKRPRIAYVPYYDDLYESYISESEFYSLPQESFYDNGWFEGTATKGRLGLTVHITKWKDANNLKTSG